MTGYIYALTCNNEIFYVGQTADLINRLSQHKCLAANGKTAKDAKVRESIELHGSLQYQILATCELDAALMLEKYFIDKYKNRGIKLHCKSTYIANVRQVCTYLTPRMKEILQLVADNNTIKKIAKKLNVSHRTIEGNITRLKKFYSVKHIGAMIYKAYKIGDIQ